MTGYPEVIQMGEKTGFTNIARWFGKCPICRLHGQVTKTAFTRTNPKNYKKLPVDQWVTPAGRE
jgi:hypothetical protein